MLSSAPTPDPRHFRRQQINAIRIADNLIQIDNELMLVDAVTPNATATGSTITVQRGYAGTTQTTHTSGTAINSVTEGGQACNDKDTKAMGGPMGGTGDPSEMDIAFLNAGSVGNGNPLDNVSGTIYDAGPRADFENSLFGSANLAVITSSEGS